MSDDPYRLERFVEAQSGGVYDQALAELRRGRKTSHWMWFVFPQVAGLGSSPTSRCYAVGSRAEAQAYLAHPVLGPRLRECAQAVLAFDGAPEDLLGDIDAAKAALLDDALRGCRRRRAGVRPRAGPPLRRRAMRAHVEVPGPAVIVESASRHP